MFEEKVEVSFCASIHRQNIHICTLLWNKYIFRSSVFVRLCYQVSQPIIKRGQFFKREWTLTIFVISYTQVFLLSVWISRMYEQVLCSLNRNSTHIRIPFVERYHFSKKTSMISFLSIQIKLLKEFFSLFLLFCKMI